MGFFDDYFDPQQYVPGRGLTGLLESIQQHQNYQPGGFAGWPQSDPAANPGIERPPGQQPLLPQATPTMSVGQPAQYPVGGVPMPMPRPADFPSQSIPVGNYLMPQFGAGQGGLHAETLPDIGERLGAGFRSWAYTPVGNPFAALANAITGFNSGQLALAPIARPRHPLIRQFAQSSEEPAITAPAAPTQAQPAIRMFARRRFAPGR